MKNVTAYVEKNTVPFDKAVVFEELKGASYNPRQRENPCHQSSVPGNREILRNESAPAIPQRRRNWCIDSAAGSS